MKASDGIGRGWGEGGVGAVCFCLLLGLLREGFPKEAASELRSK